MSKAPALFPPRPISATVDVGQAAAYLGIGQTLVRQLIRAGNLPHVRLGRLIRIRQEALDQYLLSQEARAAASATNGR